MLIDAEMKILYKNADELMQDHVLKEALGKAGYNADTHKAFYTIVDQGYVGQPSTLENILLVLQKFYSDCVAAAVKENTVKNDAVRSKVTPLFLHVSNKQLEDALLPPEVVANNALIKKYSEDLKVISFALADPRLRQIDPTFSEPSMSY